MKEQDIRPEHLHQRYLELSAEDAERCFSGVERRVIPCVACGSAENHLQFEKNGFAYTRCDICGTSFNVRARLHRCVRGVSGTRLLHGIGPRNFSQQSPKLGVHPFSDHVWSGCRSSTVSRRINVGRLVEVGAGFEIFLEEWRARFPQTELFAIEPSGKLAQECRRKGFSVVEDIVENVTGYDAHGDLVVCFEVIEHVYDPVSS